MTFRIDILDVVNKPFKYVKMFWVVPNTLGPSTMAGLMTTISNSLSRAKDHAAFSVIVFVSGPQSCEATNRC